MYVIRLNEKDYWQYNVENKLCSSVLFYMTGFLDYFTAIAICTSLHGSCRKLQSHKGFYTANSLQQVRNRNKIASATIFIIPERKEIENYLRAYTENSAYYLFLFSKFKVNNTVTIKKVCFYRHRHVLLLNSSTGIWRFALT